MELSRLCYKTEVEVKVEWVRIKRHTERTDVDELVVVSWSSRIWLSSSMERMNGAGHVHDERSCFRYVLATLDDAI